MNIIKITNREKNVLDSLREDFNIPLDASCSGNGTCGKCKVRVIKGSTQEIEEMEKKFLSQQEINSGIRLACNITPIDELEIEVDFNPSNGQILESHTGFKGIINSLVKKTYLKLSKPSIADQRDDITRISEALNLFSPKVKLDLRQRLPRILEKSDYCINVCYTDKEIIFIEPGTPELENYSIACDIGTTTVVTYLLDNISGVVIDTFSQLNSQKTFGADVISRIDYCINNSDGTALLQKKIVNQLGTMAEYLIKKNSISSKNVNSFIIAGNTTMLHLLTGVNPKSLATAPFIPVFLDTFNCNFKELGDFPFDCQLFTLPSISSYVGGDIVAGVLATDMELTDDISLLVDLGTNGEIILGNKNRYYSCSTAAGPAFEGAHIQYGVGAISGAINSFNLNSEQNYTTIGNEKPIGICGSGIVDIVSEFLVHNIIDETGRFNEDELENDPRYIKDGEGSYIVAFGSETLKGDDIVFTQKDLREVQLAKASISAGIETLIHHSQIERKEIKNLFIAGGFGNYIDKVSSAKMGLIPQDLLKISTSVGNTAGLGAIYCALSEENLKLCSKIVKKTTYIELSNSPYFQDKYIEGMIF